MIQDGDTGFLREPNVYATPEDATTVFYRLSMEQLNLENMKCYCYSSVGLDM